MSIRMHDRVMLKNGINPSFRVVGESRQEDGKIIYKLLCETVHAYCDESELILVDNNILHASDCLINKDKCFGICDCQLEGVKLWQLR